MIQRTIYVMTSPEREGVKVGMAFDVETRAKTLGDWRRGRPLDVVFVAKSPLDKGAVTERLAHWLLRDNRISGEWFSVSVEEAASAITLAIEQICDPMWEPPWPRKKKYVEARCVGDRNTRFLLTTDHIAKLDDLSVVPPYNRDAGTPGRTGGRTHVVRCLVSECYDRLVKLADQEEGRVASRSADSPEHAAPKG